MKKEETFKCLKDTPTGTYKAGVIYTDAFCSAFPEYFAPFVFTTHDGIDIYVGDVYWIADGCVYSKTCHSNWQEINSHLEFKRFSTHDLAQAHIDEQNKLKWEIGKVYTDGKSNIFYCTRVVGKKAYGYGFLKGLWVPDDEYAYSNYPQGYTVATPEEWEAALIKEAERLGFNVCKKVSRDYLENKSYQVCEITGEYGGFDYYQDRGKEALSYKYVQIYWNGKWASIIQEPEREKTSDDYIEEYWKSQTASFASFLKENNLIITKAPSHA